MTRKQPVQKKKRSSSNTGKPKPPELKKTWSRSDILTTISITVAIIGLLLSLTIPEVRQFIGLDHPTIANTHQLYPHLRQYYIGDEQIIPSKKLSSLILFISWEAPPNSSVGAFVGYVDLTSSNQTNCTVSGSMNSPNNSSYTHITFSCTFLHNLEEIFRGEIYPDGHISGLATNPADQRFTAIWHFYLPGSPALKNIPTPPAKDIPTLDGDANWYCPPPPRPC